MSYFFWHWWHHSQNFPSGFAFLMPLFAWNRVAKCILLLSGLVVVIEVLGETAVEQHFSRLQLRLERAIIWSEAQSHRMGERLRYEFGLLTDFLRFLFSKETSAQKYTQGRKSWFLASMLTMIFAVALVVGALAGLSAAIASSGSLASKLEYGLFCLVFVFTLILLSSLVLLLLGVMLLMLASALFLRPLAAAVGLIIRKSLQRIQGKGAVPAWRLAAFYLLLVGFVLDLVTS